MQKFDYNQVTCLYPKLVHNPYTNELISVPCGKCSCCMTKKSFLWCTRCQEESTCHTYCLFGTLTYSDSHLPVKCIGDLDGAFYTDSFIKALDKSSDYLSFCDNKIPCLNVSDIQLFFKRLRSKINYYYGPSVKIRYFLCGQYGPTTYRPHYHFLIWHDSDALSPFLKKFVFEAWQSFSDCKTEKEFFNRNKCRYVHGYVEKYVAGYVNKSVSKPAIFYEKPFREFHIQSSNPPIGTIRFLRESIQGLISGHFDKIVLHKSSTGDAVLLPLWRGLENRFFPKCIGYSDLDFNGRKKLYGLFSEFYSCFSSKVESFSRESSFDDFFQWSLSEREKDNYGFQIFEDLQTSYHNDSERFSEQWLSSFKRLYQISKRVFTLSNVVGCSVSDYVSAIEQYYRRKEYDSLLIQMKFQQKLAVSRRSDVDLRYYPFIVDSLFYNNMRNLSSYQIYLEQFGLINCDPCFFVPQFSVPWQQKKALSDKIIFDMNQNQVKKDYVASHPECFQNYKSLLRPISLTS